MAVNPPSEDLKYILVNNGVGTFAASSGWSINVSREPTSPDTAISLYDNGGANPHPALTLDELDVQVRVRGAVHGYQSGYDKVQEVRDALLGIPAQTINGTDYRGIIMRGDINFIQYDDNERPVWTLNFIVWREPAATGNRSSF